MCVRHEGQLFMILSFFVHLSVCIWPWTDWGDKPKPIDGNWSTCSAWIGVLAKSHRMAICCHFNTKKEIAPTYDRKNDGAN